VNRPGFLATASGPAQAASAASGCWISSHQIDELPFSSGPLIDMRASVQLTPRQAKKLLVGRRRLPDWARSRTWRLARAMAICVSKAIRRKPQLLLREVPISGIGAEHPAFMAIPAFDGFQGTETPFEIGIERGGIVCRYRTMPGCRLSSLAKSGGAKCRAQSVLIDITPTAVARGCAACLRLSSPSGYIYPPFGCTLPTRTFGLHCRSPAGSSLVCMSSYPSNAPALVLFGLDLPPPSEH
jgi:hypothetical protein